ncbi:hypothetical protein [Rhizobium sp. Root1220]|uniref:hypothetical protein n=1 Tax=Rhizobium sp. Root1220 TaxID=1736432 RepID=UPI0012E3EB0C|nr:hypothetical protein [Rhizobium sp. Root1220]
MSSKSFTPLDTESLKLIEDALRKAGLHDTMMTANLPHLKAGISHLIQSFQQGVTSPAGLSIELGKFQELAGSFEFTDQESSETRGHWSLTRLHH